MVYRIFLELGWWRSFFIIGLLMFGLSRLFALQSFYTILTIHLLFIISLHLTRSDKTFLVQTPLPHALIFTVEYAVLSLPFLIYFLVHQAFIPFCTVLIGIFLLGFVKFHIKTKPLQSVSFAWIPAHIFEWRAGLRVSWLFLLLMYLLAVVFYAHETVLILCWVLLIIFFSTFYLQAEGRVLLQLPQLPARTFLFEKAKDYLVLSFLFLSPIYMLFFINHIQLWQVGVILILLSLCLPFFVVFQKYASWQAHISLQPNIFLHLLFLASFALPFLFPVGVFLLIRAYYKAIRNFNSV